MPSSATLHGLLVLNKPVGITSRAAVDLVARLVRPSKVGHAGTLDPLATGVLVVAVGRATRLIEYVQRTAKRYRAVFELGCTSDSDDIEGEVRAVEGAAAPDRAAVERALQRFIGVIRQRPPAHSAVHVAGRRAYALARAGQTVDLEPRDAEVYSIVIARYEYPRLELEMACGSGVYVRSIGRDLGEALGTGAVMAALERTAVERFQVADAVDPRELDRAAIRERLLPMSEAVADLPDVHLTAQQARRMAMGQAVQLEAPQATRLAVSGETDLAVYLPSGELLGIGACDTWLRVRPKRVLAAETVLPAE